MRKKSGKSSKGIKAINSPTHKIYCRTFSSNDGKMILEDLATTCGMYRSNFVQGSTEYTSFLEGQRSLFLYICAQLAEKMNNIEGKE